MYSKIPGAGRHQGTFPIGEVFTDAIAGAYIANAVDENIGNLLMMADPEGQLAILHTIGEFTGIEADDGYWTKKLKHTLDGLGIDMTLKTVGIFARAAKKGIITAKELIRPTSTKGYHISTANFDQFSQEFESQAFGTQSNMPHGKGLYFADTQEGVEGRYFLMATREGQEPVRYTVKVKATIKNDLLQLDVPLSKQSKKVQAKLKPIMDKYLTGEGIDPDVATGRDLMDVMDFAEGKQFMEPGQSEINFVTYRQANPGTSAPEKDIVAGIFKEHGILGTTFNKAPRTFDKAAKNDTGIVMFDDSLIEITEKVRLDVDGNIIEKMEVKPRVEPEVKLDLEDGTEINRTQHQLDEDFDVLGRTDDELALVPGSPNVVPEAEPGFTQTEDVVRSVSRSVRDHKDKSNFDVPQEGDWKLLSPEDKASAIIDMRNVDNKVWEITEKGIDTIKKYHDVLDDLSVAEATGASADEISLITAKLDVIDTDDYVKLLVQVDAEKGISRREIDALDSYYKLVIETDGRPKTAEERKQLKIYGDQFGKARNHEYIQKKYEISTETKAILSDWNKLSFEEKLQTKHGKLMGPGKELLEKGAGDEAFMEVLEESLNTKHLDFINSNQSQKHKDLKEEYFAKASLQFPDGVMDDIMLEKPTLKDALEHAIRSYNRTGTKKDAAKVEMIYDLIQQKDMKGSGTRKEHLIQMEDYHDLIMYDQDPSVYSHISNLRAKANKPGAKGIAAGDPKLNQAGRAVATAADIAIDMRTNNILFSLGQPMLAIVGGVGNKALRTIEEGVATGLLKLTGKTYKPKVTDEEINVTKVQLDNILYTLSGGKVQTNDRDLKFEDILDLITGLGSASNPSRMDAKIVQESEALLGAGMKPGYKEALGVDPAGLSRLGVKFEGFENPAVRNLLKILLSAVESLPRKGLATVDEGLKTREMINEFVQKLDVNLAKLEGVGVKGAKLNHDRIYKEMRQVFIESLGAEGNALDITKLMMNKLRNKFGTSQSQINGLLSMKRSYEDVLLRNGIEVPEGGFTTTSDYKESFEMLMGMNPTNISKAELDDLAYAVEMLPLAQEFQALEGHLEGVIKRTLDGAQQFARETTVTQDVPQMMQGFISGWNSNKFLRGMQPFLRSITNIAVMAQKRIPGLNYLLAQERAAFTGSLGNLEQARHFARMSTGTGIMVLGYHMSQKDKGDGIRITSQDHGKWVDYFIEIPMTATEYRTQLFTEGSRTYNNNKELINRELKRRGLEENEFNAINMMVSELPQYEDTGKGFIRVDTSRLAPVATLLSIGDMANKAWDKEGHEYTTFLEDDENGDGDYATAALSKIAKGASIIDRLGYFDTMTQMNDMLTNSEYAVPMFFSGWVTDMVSFGKGFRSTAGEPGQQEFRPSTQEGYFDQKGFNQLIPNMLGVGEPDKVMKKVDFLGRVVDAPDRIGHVANKKMEVDMINSELEFWGLYKRVTKWDQVPIYGQLGIDLRKYTPTPELLAHKVYTKLAVRKGQNAYEDFLTIKGQANVDGFGSAKQQLNKYFKSKEYKAYKESFALMNSDEEAKASSSNEWDVKVAAAEKARKQVNNRINKIIKEGSKYAERKFMTLSGYYVDKDGKTLHSALQGKQQTVQQGESELFQKSGLGNF